jgi:hypothetical protein
MLRIELIKDETQNTTIRAAGQLAGPWVQVLAHSLDPNSHDGRLVLDLVDVSFADPDGVALLRSLTTETRISLRCSPFLAAQLV